jgi:NAD(P)-dependent dehydrogenase (short-subunit alcohol dehydrogenase family)
MDRKVVLITGCSSGFGQHLVTGALQGDYQVIATMRNAESRINLFSHNLESYPGQLNVLSLDVTDENQRKATLKFLEDKHGRLDCLINNAGYALFGSLEDMTESQIRQQMETNFFGTVLLTKSFLPLLRDSQGRIINISSVFGYAGFPLTSAYCASKYAIEGFTESLYYELKPHGVQVALVEPGGHRTNFGTNIVWGEHSFGKSSAFFSQSINYRRFREKLTSRKGQSPDRVVRSILKLMQSHYMPLRSRIGSDAHILHFIRKLFPQKLGSRLLARTYAKIFERNIEVEAKVDA